MAIFSGLTSSLFSRKKSANDIQASTSNDSPHHQPSIHVSNHASLTSTTYPTPITASTSSISLEQSHIHIDCNDCNDTNFDRPSTPIEPQTPRQTDCTDCADHASYNPTTPIEHCNHFDDFPNMDDDAWDTAPSSTFPPQIPTLATDPTPASLKRKEPSTSFDLYGYAKRTLPPLEWETGVEMPEKTRPDDHGGGEEERGELVRRTVSGVGIPAAEVTNTKHEGVEDEKGTGTGSVAQADDVGFLGWEDGDMHGSHNGGGAQHQARGIVNIIADDDGEVEDMVDGTRFVVEGAEDDEETLEQEGGDAPLDLFATFFGNKSSAAVTIDSDSDSDSEPNTPEAPAPSTTHLPATTTTTKSTTSAIKPIPREPQPSPHLLAHHKLHTRILPLLPRLPLAPHRYWIAVLPPNTNPRTLTSEKQITWLRGNRLTTVETVWRMYALSTVSEGFVLMLGGGEKGWKGDVPGWECRMEELDVFGDRRVVFRAVGEGEMGMEGEGVGGSVWRGLVCEGKGRGRGEKETEVVVLDD